MRRDPAPLPACALREDVNANRSNRKAKRQTGADALAAVGHYTRGPPPRNRLQAVAAPSPAPARFRRRPDEPHVGLLAPLTVLASLGLAAVAVADGASRSGRPWGGCVVFWSAIFVCAVAFAVRLAGSRASRVERILIVLAFGLFLYVVKILRDPVGFTYADELVHAYNVNSIVSTHSLFGPNPLLPVTPHYPGLETVAAALQFVGGSSTFTAGVIVVALARTMMMLTLFSCSSASPARSRRRPRRARLHGLPGLRLPRSPRSPTSPSRCLSPWSGPMQLPGGWLSRRSTCRWAPTRAEDAEDRRGVRLP